MAERALIAETPRPIVAADGGRWAVLAAVGVASYMSALDGSIVNAILPVLAQQLGADVAAIQWVVTVYLLVQSGLLLSFGRLGDMVGHRRVYAAGLALFVLASALCGLAGSVNALVGARALQAVGASMLIAGAPPLLTQAFPPSHRGRVLGWMAAAVYLGLASGPVLGGWLATVADWRAVFFVNVPVGLAALALALRFVPRDAPAGRREPFDLAGVGVYVLGLVALLLALNQGHACAVETCGPPGDGVENPGTVHAQLVAHGEDRHVVAEVADKLVRGAEGQVPDVRVQAVGADDEFEARRAAPFEGDLYVVGRLLQRSDRVVEQVLGHRTTRQHMSPLVPRRRRPRWLRATGRPGRYVEPRAPGSPQGRVSTHLCWLRWCGYVATRRDGRNVYYRLADDRVPALLRIAHDLMADHARELLSCQVLDCHAA
jgi:hypothetical protein